MVETRKKPDPKKTEPKKAEPKPTVTGKTAVKPVTKPKK